MKRLMTVTLSALALSVGASPSLFAIDNICWRINGFPLQTALSFVGNADGASVYNVQGRGTSTGVPIAGTLVFPPAGAVLLSFSIQAASPAQRRAAPAEPQPHHPERHRQLPVVRQHELGGEHRHVRLLRDRPQDH